MAARAGVSTATVSRALRGLAVVSDAARTRVLEAAASLGYVVSPTAQALATGRTQTIAVVVPSFAEWFIAHVLEGAQRRIQSLGFATVVHSVANARGKPVIDFDVDLLRRRADGLMIVGMPLSETETDQVRSLEVPVVIVGNLNPPFVSVVLDDLEAGLIATHHLLELGHRVIGHISGSNQEISDLTPGGGRLAGWHAALEAAGLEHGDDLFAQSYFDISGGREAALELIDRRPDITAIFAAADCIAAGAIQALSERGLSVPDDVSIIGVDGEMTDGRLSLTTVVQHPEDQGRIAADALIRMIHGGAAIETIRLHGALLRGETTSVPRQR